MCHRQFSYGAIAGLQRPAYDQSLIYMRRYSIAQSLLLGTVLRETLDMLPWQLSGVVPVGSLAWNFSFVLIGQPSSLSLSVRIVHIYIWGLSF